MLQFFDRSDHYDCYAGCVFVFLHSASTCPFIGLSYFYVAPVAGWMVVAAPRPSPQLQALNGGDWYAALSTSLTTATFSLTLRLSLIAADPYILNHLVHL